MTLIERMREQNQAKKVWNKKRFHLLVKVGAITIGCMEGCAMEDSSDF